MKTYKCLSCGREFTVDVGKVTRCFKCGSDEIEFVPVLCKRCGHEEWRHGYDEEDKRGYCNFRFFTLVCGCKGFEPED